LSIAMSKTLTYPKAVQNLQPKTDVSESPHLLPLVFDGKDRIPDGFDTQFKFSVPLRRRPREAVDSMS
jgi:hypothetical protein